MKLKLVFLTCVLIISSNFASYSQEKSQSEDIENPKKKKKKNKKPSNKEEFSSNTMPLQIFIVEFNGTCEDAENYIKDPASKQKNPSIYSAALMKIGECNLINQYVQNNPKKKKPKDIKEEHKVRPVVIYDAQHEEEYFGFIKQGVLDEFKKYSSGAINSLGAKISETDPVTGTIVTLTSHVAINSFYKAVEKEDPTVILQPMVLPGNEAFKTLAGSFNKEWAIDLEKLNNEIIKDLKGEIKNAGEYVERKPLVVVDPINTVIVETVPEAAKSTEEVVKQTVKNPEKNIDVIVAPVIVAPIKVVKDMFDW